MRNLRKNQQKMYYAVPNGTRDKYEKDDLGNVKMMMIDGVLEPVSAGGIESSYTKPQKFFASISSKLNEMHAVSYGVDQSSIYSEICLRKGEIPLKYGMKIWKNSEVKYLISEAHGEPDVDSADYTVRGIMDEFQDYDWILLQRNNK